MTKKEAESELMQLYGSLSEEKKKALDVAFKAMEQADNMPVMYYPQVYGITPTVVAQADGDLISKDAVIEWLKDIDMIKTSGQEKNAREQLTKLPSVDIPPDHDGCKDCVYQANPQDAMPCRECKQNYMDKWKARPKEEPNTGHWITKIKSDLRGDMWPTNPKCSKCGGEPSFNNTIYSYDFCPYCGCKMVEPQERSEK